MSTSIANCLPTDFASAERLSGTQIAEQVATLESGGRLKSLIDSMPSLVALLNDERQVLLGNEAWENLARSLRKESFEGMRLGEFLSCRRAVSADFGCGTTEACRTCGATQAILCARAGQRTSKECRIATVTRDGYAFLVSTSPFEWQGRGYVLLVLNDISGEKRRQVLEKIFFHDVLNTASGVSGIAALIAGEPALCVELKDDLLLSADTLVNEIKSQRMLLAAEQDQLQVQLAPVSAKEALESARHLYRNHPVAAGRRIEIDPSGAGFTVKTDPTILQRVLTNMLKNALEASKQGDIVWLGADAGPEAYTFWCQNSGEIPDDVALQVFQRSFSTKGVGRGIGTYSIKLLGERFLGGRVSFTTSAEEGTRFQITLPRAP